ncbi:hypothetical protein PanWU01x14_159330 [Parasponia andersonii]|uniref:Uncharacterized protein n=1 Tax=Parasponia andersonii TaxID=3476 RepID=A0A2P5CED2_PARAD|nr:hypothetical protein PanWU01x14_159330 [Parasponia andersonii]
MMTTDLARGWDAITLLFKILDKDTKIEFENPQGCKPEKITGCVELCNGANHLRAFNDGKEKHWEGQALLWLTDCVPYRIAMKLQWWIEERW